MSQTLQRSSPIQLGPMPAGRAMETIDERLVRAPVGTIFQLVREVEYWPALLSHYRFVRFQERDPVGGGVVAMSANRPFGLLDWPTWWTSRMAVDPAAPAIRFHHIAGVTKGMDVEWRFEAVEGGTQVRVVHVWDGPNWPLIGVFAATAVIGPVFVHGIASRTLEGLAREAERRPSSPVTRHSSLPAESRVPNHESR